MVLSFCFSSSEPVKINEEEEKKKYESNSDGDGDDNGDGDSDSKKERKREGIEWARRAERRRDSVSTMTTRMGLLERQSPKIMAMILTLDDSSQTQSCNTSSSNPPTTSLVVRSITYENSVVFGEI